MENVNVTFENEGGMTPSETTMQEMLAKNIGKYVICELLIGLRSMTIRDGILIEVGQNYFILQNPTNGDHTSCDLYSLKFITIPATTGHQGQYSPYGYTKPNCTSGGTNAQSACWIRVD